VFALAMRIRLLSSRTPEVAVVGPLSGRAARLHGEGQQPALLRELCRGRGAESAEG